MLQGTLLLSAYFLTSRGAASEAAVLEEPGPVCCHFLAWQPSGGKEGSKDDAKWHD